jgi:hypothetical protein
VREEVPATNAAPINTNKTEAITMLPQRLLSDRKTLLLELSMSSSFINELTGINLMAISAWGSGIPFNLEKTRPLL